MRGVTFSRLSDASAAAAEVPNLLDLPPGRLRVLSDPGGGMQDVALLDGPLQPSGSDELLADQPSELQEMGDVGRSVVELRAGEGPLSPVRQAIAFR